MRHVVSFSFCFSNKFVLQLFKLSLLYFRIHALSEYLNFFAFLVRSNSRMTFAFKLKRSIAHSPQKDKAKCDGSSQEAFTLYTLLLYTLLYTLFLWETSFIVFTAYVMGAILLKSMYTFANLQCVNKQTRKTVNIEVFKLMTPF